MRNCPFKVLVPRKKPEEALVEAQGKGKRYSASTRKGQSRGELPPKGGKGRVKKGRPLRAADLNKTRKKKGTDHCFSWLVREENEERAGKKS